jgi:iron complex transport system ATP-binding protein
MLALDGVSVRLGRRTVLSAVRLAVAPGELVALVGPNGAGKSTALAVLAGDLAPMRGSATLDGRNITTYSAAALALRRAVLPQSSALLFDFVVEDVVALGRAPHARHATAAHDAAVVRAALAATDLLAFAQRRYTVLSGGERARVHLARALAQIWDGKGAYLLLDEPTAALDLAHQQHALAIARRWARGGAGVLAVLHDLSLAAQHADRLVLLADGRVLAEGSPDTVLTAGNIRAAYGIDSVICPHPTEGHPVVFPRAPQIDINRPALTC